jgi:hypothetical protein
LYPFIAHVFADSGYNHERVANATNIVVEIVRKFADHRRLAKDFEASIDSAKAFLYAASVMLLVRRIARQA